MPVSLKARFNGNAKEVIEYCRVWGNFKAMEKYGVKDYVAFKKFIESETGNPNFGLNPELGSENSDNPFEGVLNAFLGKLHKMEAEKHSLLDELKRVKLELEYYKGQQSLKANSKVNEIMALCRE